MKWKWKLLDFVWFVYIWLTRGRGRIWGGRIGSVFKTKRARYLKLEMWLARHKTHQPISVEFAQHLSTKDKHKTPRSEEKMSFIDFCFILALVWLVIFIVLLFVMDGDLSLMFHAKFGKKIRKFGFNSSIFCIFA